MKVTNEELLYLERLITSDNVSIIPGYKQTDENKLIVFDDIKHLLEYKHLLNPDGKAYLHSIEENYVLGYATKQKTEKEVFLDEYQYYLSYINNGMTPPHSIVNNTVLYDKIKEYHRLQIENEKALNNLLFIDSKYVDKVAVAVEELLEKEPRKEVNNKIGYTDYLEKKKNKKQKDISHLFDKETNNLDIFEKHLMEVDSHFDFDDSSDTMKSLTADYLKSINVSNVYLNTNGTIVSIVFDFGKGKTVTVTTEQDFNNFVRDYTV